MPHPSWPLTYNSCRSGLRGENENKNMGISEPKDQKKPKEKKRLLKGGTKVKRRCVIVKIKNMVWSPNNVVVHSYEQVSFTCGKYSTWHPV